jgi:hypothetical protein
MEVRILFDNLAIFTNIIRALLAYLTDPIGSPERCLMLCVARITRNVNGWHKSPRSYYGAKPDTLRNVIWLLLK